MTIDDAVERVMSDLMYVRRGKMFGHTAFFADRKMFACLFGEGVAVRVSGEETTGASEVREFSPHGRRMRNWVLLVYSDTKRVVLDRALFVRAAEEVRC